MSAAAESRAVVLVSGGLDSATVLAMARSAGHECHALSFDYGQRHRAELEAARRVVQAQDVTDHRFARLDIGWMGGSALTDENILIPHEPQSGIPITYVPARNTIFLAVALGWAEVLEAGHIYIGANAVDFSGYPDCRPEFIQAFQNLANVGTQAGVEGHGFRIEAPLIALSKAEIIRAGLALGVDYSLTVSCYALDAEGRACGLCDACRLRANGFAEAGVDDPTPYQPLAQDG
jgi:7-cyano-7-deazaguanine synthase